MSSLLASHVEQINTCSRSISELPFTGPRSFTNAILSSHDITALIRDTEAHERALFHLAPPTLPEDIGGNSTGVAPISSAALKSRRATIHASRQPKSKAVAAVLGGELYARIQAQPSRQAGEVDVDLLLQGAQKLATVYPIAGALERIAQLRRRHGHLQANIAHYEERVAQQSLELEKMRSTSSAHFETDVDAASSTTTTEITTRTEPADTDPNAMQEEIKELEQKKKGLENRVTGMERDLGGLLR